MEREKFLITGADGFLGKRLFDLYSQEHIVAGLDILNRNNSKAELVDITDKDKVVNFIKKFTPQVIIHAAAISSVDECEKNPQKAWQVNVKGTRNVALASQKVGAKLIFTSSLHVFDGRKGDYSEVDKPNPISVYGKTKVAAEKIILETSPKNIVLRVGTLYGYDGTAAGTPMTALEKFKKGERITGLIDAIRNFTFIDDFPPAILVLLKENQRGIFNFCGFEKLSDYQFLLMIAGVFGLDESLIKPEKAEAYFSRNATLKTDKIKKLGIKMHSPREGLEIVKSQMKQS